MLLKRGVRRAVAGGLCGVVVATIASCGGGNSEHADTTTSRASATTGRGGSSTTGGDTTTTTGSATVTPEGLDLAETPALFTLLGRSGPTESRLARFEHAAAEPEIVLEGASGSELTMSPDLRHVAVTSRGDAVRGARLEIVSASTGEIEAAFETDADLVTVQQWAPDSSTLVLWQRRASETTFGAYRVDGTEIDLGSDRIVSISRLVWATKRGVVTAMIWEPSSTPPITLRASDGELVLVTQGYNIEHGYYDTATEEITPHGEGYVTRQACGRFALLDRPTESGREVAVFDADTREVVEVGTGDPGPTCPVASNDGTQVAVEIDGGVNVVDLDTGRSRQVARQGLPLAWGGDDTSLLVSGNGLFVVAADGGGGGEASVDLGSYACIVGTTGTIITVDQQRVVVRYDIATDSSEVLGVGSPIQREHLCQVSTDRKWLLVNTTLVDLAGGHASAWTPSPTQLLELPQVGALFFGEASWIGPALRIQG